MSEMIERISLALMAHLRADEQDDFRLAARDAIAEISKILSNSHNSSLAYTGDELARELKTTLKNPHDIVQPTIREEQWPYYIKIK